VVEIQAHLAALQRLGFQERIALVDAGGGVGIGAVKLVERGRAERLVISAAQGELIG
jgi:hypothetical protein